MDFVDEFIATVDSLPQHMQVEVRKKLDTFWANKAVDNKYDMSKIVEAFNLVSLTGKVTLPKLLKTLGIRKQEDKNQFLGFVRRSPKLFRFNSKKELLGVYLAPQFNSETSEYMEYTTKVLNDCLFILKYRGKFYLTVMGRYLSLVNHTDKILTIVDLLNNKELLKKENYSAWNPLEMYNFTYKHFETIPTKVWELSETVIQFLIQYGFRIQYVNTRQYSDSLAIKYINSFNGGKG